MEDQNVTLPFRLSMMVYEELKKQGVMIELKQGEIIPTTFSQEQLAKITKLSFLNPPDDLDGIDMLPNLQMLNIRSDGRTEYFAPKDRPSIGDRASKVISRCTNLKQLSIINQGNLESLDISQLKNLEFLTVTRNLTLEVISGLENMRNLESLCLYGNEVLTDYGSLNKVLQNNPELFCLDLDVLMFPNVVGYNMGNGSHDSDAVDRLIDMLNDCQWREDFSSIASIKLSTAQMINMHNKACEILDENVPLGSQREDTIIGIENYLARNVAYDFASIKGAASHTSVEDGWIRGPKHGANGAFNALMFNTCVCEGYTRGMQYLLKLKGITSHNVHCIATKDTSNLTDIKRQENQREVFQLPKGDAHSIICIDGYNGLYCDPCWDAGLYQSGDKTMPYTLKTQREISEDHTLLYDEGGIYHNDMAVSQSTISKSLKRNEVFRNTRYKDVRAKETEIGRSIKGRILTQKEREASRDER